jgi:predicted membrane chloride channel (bestrophin family)
MIVTAVPGAKQVIREIWKPLAVLFVWDVTVTITYYWLPFTAPSLPLTLFGSALALVLGFRSNSAYQRWWEGRGLWGAMINASRSLARQARNFLPEEAVDLKRTLVRYAVNCGGKSPITMCYASCRKAKRRRLCSGPTSPTASSTGPAEGSIGRAAMG